MKVKTNQEKFDILERKNNIALLGGGNCWFYQNFVD
jgi:hypothetical protein